MSVPVISWSGDVGANGKVQTPKWSDESLKILWSSLLNLEFVSNYNEDAELQGILLLLDTAFGVFKSLKTRCDDAVSACQIMKHDLEAAKENLHRMNEDIKRHNQAFCERCPELDRELRAHRNKLEHNENLIRSIVSLLGINNSTEVSERNIQSSPKTAMVKAYDLVSQMLLDSDVASMEMDEICGTKSGNKRLGLDSVEDLQLRTLGKKRKKRNKMASKVDILNVGDRHKDVKHLYFGATLAPESVAANKMDKCPDVEREIVPETLCSPHSTNFSEMEKTVSHLRDTDLMEKADDIQTTPKKQVLQEKVAQKTSSPILVGFGRKSAHKFAHCSNYVDVDSRPNCPMPSEAVGMNAKSDVDQTPNNCKDSVDRSPSLLKIQMGVSGSIVTGADEVVGDDEERKSEKNIENVLQPPEAEEKSTKAGKADFWKLKTTSYENVKNRKAAGIRSRRLKQTTLSLACLPQKQDLCTLREFNGGIRQSACESTSLANVSGDHDDETSRRLVIQKSLYQKENTECGPPEGESTGFRNPKIDYAEDDDVVEMSPDASYPRTSPRKKHRHTRDKPAIIRTGDNTSNTGWKKEQIQRVNERKDMDETLFVPLYTSTLQDVACSSTDVGRVPETEDFSSKQNPKHSSNLDEVTNRKKSEIVRKHDCSFDRIPEKISTSPNYKYRRDAVRNREARQKLDGWECEQCKNYYAVAHGGADPTVIKRHLKQCSRHRDKYNFQTNTPAGYWDVNFPSTEESRLDDTSI